MTETGAGQLLGRSTLTDAFAREARRGVQLAIIGRLVAFGLLWASYVEDAYTHLLNPYFEYRTALILVALVGGGLNYLFSRRSAHPVAWCFAFLAVDLMVVGGLVFGWVPPAISDYPQYLAVRLQDLLIFVAILMISVLPLSRALALLAGGATIAVWLGGIAISFATTPHAAFAGQAIRGARDWEDLLVRVSRPLVLNLDLVALQMVMIAVLAGLLWLGVDQGRRLVVQTVRAEADRAFLARFFPPAVARYIAASGQRALPGMRGDAAILFADFDRERLGVGEFDALKSYYDRVEREVFRHGGVIERFVGDPVMAVFGVLPVEDGGPEGPPALAALDCARALLALDGAVRPVTVGLNHGSVVSGEVGSRRQRAFGVVGDAVNIARRMLDAARDAGGGLRATAEFARQVEHEGGGASALQPAGSAAVRGRDGPVPVWTLAP